MRLMMFEASGGPRLGVVEGDKVIDVAAADLALPKTMLALIEAGPDALARVAAAVKGAGAEATLALKDVTPALPIERPGKFVCVGLNYAAHAREGGHEPPKYPSLFVRWPSSLVAAEAPVILPKVCEQLDYEAELTFVIGKGGRAIPEDKGLDHVFGYTLFNDVSVRAWQRYTPQWTQGKNFDGTGPLGPVVVTPDELPAGASGLRITRRGRHGHAVGRRPCHETAGLDEGWRPGRGRGRRHRHPGQSHRRRGLTGMIGEGRRGPPLHP